MKIKSLAAAVALCLPLSLHAQSPRTAPAPPPAPGPKIGIVYHSELGKWWQNSEIAKKIQLSEGQISQLDQIFYDHKLKLIDYGAEMERQDLKLQTLLDADVPNEGQVEMQVDQVLGARGKLEREYTMMNLDLRKVLSLDQWRQLRSIRGQGGAFGDKIFFRKVLPPSAPPAIAPLPEGTIRIPPPIPPGDEEQMF